MNAAELFAKMDECFNAEAASGINAVFQYNFSDDDNYYVVIEDGTKDIQKGDHDSPTVTISTDVATLVGTVDGSVNGMQAFMSGKLKASGNVILAQKMQALFPISV
ncbi:MAG: SCP2 sterol-binding domain-containing protein [Gammaproteobacteria bacterium]|nr:SCP2 sterol-binding domain-containing protein [Gammaproteobacteria bacterium]